MGAPRFLFLGERKGAGGMIEDLRLVYELQGTDDRLAAFRRERLRLAEEGERIDAGIQQAEQALEEMRNALEAKRKAYRDLERDLEQAEDSIRKFKEQQFAVKTNKEYAALDAEIRRSEGAKSDLEEQALFAMEEIEARSTELAETVGALEAQRADAARRKAHLESEQAKLAEEEAATRNAREEWTAQIPEDLLSRYEKVRDHNHGVGVATVKSRACSGCFRLITPQDINLIRRSDRRMYCEGCGAILVWADGGEEGPGGSTG